MPQTRSLPPWWEETSDDKILKAADRLYKEYVGADMNRISAQMAYGYVYINRSIMGNDFLSMYTAAYNKTSTKYSRVPLNVCKIMADAAHSRVTRQSIAVKFLTDVHNYSTRKGARQMERYVDHQEHQAGGSSVYKQVYLDAIVGGTGVVSTDIHPKMDDVVVERVRATDVFVDPRQAAVTDKPCDMFRRKWVNKYQLKAFFPEKADEIEKANEITPQSPAAKLNNASSVDRNDMVEVVYGWRLPSYDGAGDGKHILFIDGAILYQSEWEVDDFPLTFVRWKNDPTVGFWGIGLVEEILGIHFDINNSLFHVYRAVELMPKPVAFLPAGAKIVEGQIGNAPGLIITSVDGSPRLELPMSVPTDIANLILLQWGKALEASRLSALGLPESTGGGFETGQALRDFNDIQSTELAPNFEAWQDFRVRTAQQLITGGKRVADRAKEEGRQYKVVLAKDKYTIEEIDWNNIALDPRKDSYVIQALPASALSQTFAGKKADVIDLLNSGLIDQETALALLDFPDLADFFSLVSGSRKAIEREIEIILDEQERIPFDPNNNTRLGLKLYQQHIARAQAQGVPDEIIQLLRDNVQQILALIREEQLATRNMASGFAEGLPGSPPALDINGASPQANAEGLMQ